MSAFGGLRDVRRGRAVRSAVAVAAVALALTACRDVFLTEPAPARSVVVDLAPVLLAGTADATAAQVLQNATHIRVRLKAAGGDAMIVDETIPLSMTGTTPAARLEIRLDRPRVEVEGAFVVLADGAALFGARDEFTLTRGERTEITPTLDPEVASVTVQAVGTVTELGSRVEVQATALYATGQAVEGATFTYQSSNTSVLAPLGGNAFEAVGEGSATVAVFATAGPDELDASDNGTQLPVTVAVPVSQITANPATLDLDVGESATVQFTARDADGNPLPRSFSYSSDSPETATITGGNGGSATVTGVSQGATIVRASVGGLEAEVTVEVTQPLGTGDVQVTLTWNTTADLDLWVTDPSGELIYFGNPSSASGGQLDVDDIDGFGPENVFWPTGGAPQGSYLVQVNHFFGAAPTDWEVTVLTPSGTNVYTGTIGTDQTDHVTTFNVGTATPVCAVQGTISTGASVTGTLSGSDCDATWTNSTGDVARAWTFTTTQEAVLFVPVGQAPGGSLWRGDAGKGGRAGFLFGGGSVMHLEAGGTYTLTVEGPPGASFQVSTGSPTGDETDHSGDVIQWSEPVSGRSLSITGDDPLTNSHDEHHDLHAIWPPPNVFWEVVVSSASEFRYDVVPPEVISTTVSRTVDGSLFSNAGLAFPIASYMNDVPQSYTFTLGPASNAGMSAADKVAAAVRQAGAVAALRVVGSGGLTAVLKGGMR